MRKISFLFFCILILLWNTSMPLAEQQKVYSLEDLIKVGLESSPAAAALRQGIAADKSLYQASKRFLNPEFEYERGRAKSYDGQVDRPTEGFSLTQPVENPFKRHYRIQIEKSRWESSQYRYDILLLDIKTGIKSEFYSLLYLQKEAELSEKNLESIREIHQMIKTRADLGEVKELDAVKLYVEVLKAEKETARIETEIQLARGRLNTSLGNSLPPDFSLSGKLNYTGFSGDDSLLVEQALSQHPRILEQQAVVEQAGNLRSYVKWQRLPDFKLSGFSRRELDGKNRGIGISLEIPLWNQWTQETAEAGYRAEQQNFQLSAMKLDVAATVLAALARVRLAEKSLDIFNQGLLNQAEESLKIARLSYTEGEISLIDFLDSQRTYYSIQTEYFRALLAWHHEYAQLEKTLGEDLR